MVIIWKNLWEFLFEPLFSLNGCGDGGEEATEVVVEEPQEALPP